MSKVMTVREAFEARSLLYTNIWVCMQFDILESISVFNGARIHVCTEYNVMWGWRFALIYTALVNVYS